MSFCLHHHTSRKPTDDGGAVRLESLPNKSRLGGQHWPLNQRSDGVATNRLQVWSARSRLKTDSGSEITCEVWENKFWMWGGMDLKSPLSHCDKDIHDRGH